MIGYCATGSRGIAITPIRQMKSATTQAKMGRSMKKEGIFLPLPTGERSKPKPTGRREAPPDDKLRAGFG